MASGDLPGQSQVQNAANSGQSAINNYDPTAAANDVRSGFNNLASTQLGSGGPQNANDYLKAYSGAVAANPNVQSLYSQANDAFGVPALASRANYLNTQVTNQLPMQQKLMRGFDASQEQVDNATNTALRFLQPQATAATNESQMAQQLAGQQVQAGITQNQMNLLPIQSYQGTMNQVLAAQATGFNTAAQAQLAGLQAKMQSGVQLSQEEISAMSQLQASKNSYDAAIANANASQNVATIGNQYKILPPANTLVNTVTGTSARA